MLLLLPAWFPNLKQTYGIKSNKSEVSTVSSHLLSYCLRLSLSEALYASAISSHPNRNNSLFNNQLVRIYLHLFQLCSRTLKQRKHTGIFSRVICSFELSKLQPGLHLQTGNNKRSKGFSSLVARLFMDMFLTVPEMEMFKYLSMCLEDNLKHHIWVCYNLDFSEGWESQNTST